MASVELCDAGDGAWVLRAHEPALGAIIEPLADALQAALGPSATVATRIVRHMHTREPQDPALGPSAHAEILIRSGDDGAAGRADAAIRAAARAVRAQLDTVVAAAVTYE